MIKRAVIIFELINAPIDFVHAALIHNDRNIGLLYLYSQLMFNIIVINHQAADHKRMFYDWFQKYIFFITNKETITADWISCKFPARDIHLEMLAVFLKSKTVYFWIISGNSIFKGNYLPYLWIRKDKFQADNIVYLIVT